VSGATAPVVKARDGALLRLRLQEACAVVSSFRLPREVTYQEGFVIYAGQAGLYHSIFRIANMGHITDGDLDRLLGVFRKRLRARAA